MTEWVCRAVVSRFSTSAAAVDGGHIMAAATAPLNGSRTASKISSQIRMVFTFNGLAGRFVVLRRNI